MDRKTAIKIYKLIIDDCMLFNSCVCLMLSDKNDSLSDGYQIHFRSVIAKNDVNVIKQIVDRHQLSLKEVSEKIIIYKPKKMLENYEALTMSLSIKT